MVGQTTDASDPDARWGPAPLYVRRGKPDPARSTPGAGPATPAPSLGLVGDDTLLLIDHQTGCRTMAELLQRQASGDGNPAAGSQQPDAQPGQPVPPGYGPNGRVPSGDDFSRLIADSIGDVTAVNTMTPMQAFRWYNEIGFLALPASSTQKKLAMAGGYSFSTMCCEPAGHRRRRAGMVARAARGPDHEEGQRHARARRRQRSRMEAVLRRA